MTTGKETASDKGLQLERRYTMPDSLNEHSLVIFKERRKANINMNISKLKVENMLSPKTDNPVANQFIITTDEGKYFQSYRTIIAFKSNAHDYESAKITLDVNSWDYSITTLKYLKLFLEHTIGESYLSKKEIEKKIKTGEYKIADLN